VRTGQTPSNSQCRNMKLASGTGHGDDFA